MKDRARRGDLIEAYKPDWKKSIHYAGCLGHSNAPKFSASIFAPKFDTICAKNVALINT